jgi:hypothetical protein
VLSIFGWLFCGLKLKWLWLTRGVEEISSTARVKEAWQKGPNHPTKDGILQIIQKS